MKVHALDSLSAEEMLLTLIKSDSHIQYLVTEERLAHLFATYIRSLDVETPVSAPVQYAWAVVRQNNSLSKKSTTSSRTKSAKVPLESSKSKTLQCHFTSKKTNGIGRR